MASQHLTIEETDRHLSGRRLRGKVLIARQLDPFHGREGDPGGLVVLQPAPIVDLDQEAGRVEIKVPGDPFERFVVEKADDYLGLAIIYSPNPHLAGVLRTPRRLSPRAPVTH